MLKWNECGAFFQTLFKRVKIMGRSLARLLYGIINERQCVLPVTLLMLWLYVEVIVQADQGSHERVADLRGQIECCNYQSISAFITGGGSSPRLCSRRTGNGRRCHSLTNLRASCRSLKDSTYLA